MTNIDNIGQVHNGTSILLYVIAVIVGGIIGVVISWLVTMKFVNIAQQCKIVYVAQDEIIELENNRIKQELLEKRQMFFGEITEALNLVTKLPETYRNRTTKVVYSMGLVSGNNVRSISKEVHQQIIKELTKQQKEKKQ